MLELTLEELPELWVQWLKDRQLRSELRFGQWVLNRKLADGYSWSMCYYANSEEAYLMLHGVLSGEKPFTGRKVY
jgi:hypothetical protein